MHVGRSYKAHEFFAWSGRCIVLLLLVSLVPVVLYQVAGFKGATLPWSVVLLLGTAVALVSSFKTSQTYGRSVDAQQSWASISAGSRAWGMLCCSFLPDDTARRLIRRHLAWLTALRFALRTPKPWETVGRGANAAYRRRYRVLESETRIEDELARYAPDGEAKTILAASNPALRALQLQSLELKALLDAGTLSNAAYLELLKTLRDMNDQQARSERIKNCPYPRQYAVVSALFVTIFCILLPFGMIGPFAELDAAAGDALKGYTIWLVVPFTIVIGWMFTSLDLVGDSTANPFEGGANDVPITLISRRIEIELREMLGDKDLPAPIEATNGIVT
jgi:putative membrane protein